MSGSSPATRVLHVDDDAMFLEMASRFLQREDERFEVTPAEDAAMALELLAEESFDCIVSDYDMPGMDGIQLLRAVRDADPDVPFVLFTGRGSEEVASRAISAGVTDYVQKENTPAQFTVLAKRIRNHCAARHAEESLAEVRSRYRRMLRTSPAPIVLFDEDGAIDYANPAAADVVGADGPSELLGRSVVEFIHPDVREAAAERMGTVLGDRSAVPAMQMRFVALDGREFEAIIATAPVVYDGKEGGQAVLTDVTDLDGVERETLDGRPSVGQTVEAATDVHYHVEMGGEVVTVTLDEEGIADGGIDEEEVEDLLGSDAEAAVRTLEAAIEEGSVRLHAALVSETGDRVPLVLRDGRLVGPSGDPVAALGFDPTRTDGDDGR